MFRANFNNFNLTAPFLSGVSYFFCYALPIFRANFTKQWTLSNQLQFFPASCMCVCVCVCLRHLRVFQDDCTCSEPHTIISLQSCTAFNSTAVMRPRWVRYFWQVSIFRLCQLSCTDEKNQTNCIAKILISAWRVVGNLLLINVELDKNSQLFVVLINASQLFDYPSHCIFLMFANICWWSSMSTLESLLGFTVAALLYAEGKVVTWGFFFVNCCFISKCPPKKIVDQGGKAEQENALFLYSSSQQHTFFLSLE